MAKTRTKDTKRSSQSAFLPSAWFRWIFAALGLAVLGAVLYLRYEIIENTPLALACEAGGESLTCTVRLGVILMFNHGVFGWTAMVAAVVQFWRPNLVAFGIGLVAALAGLVLYNTSASALAVALLVLSLARRVPEGQSQPAR